VVVAQIGVGLLTASGCVLMAEDSESPPMIEEPMCSLQAQAYRIDQVTLPLSASEANRMGFDLDGDELQRPDNGLASTFSTLYYTFESAQEIWLDNLQAAFDEQRVDWLIVVETCADDSDPGYVQVGLHRGRDDDGDGVYEIVDSGLQPAIGDRYAMGMSAELGEAMVPASTLVDIRGGHEPVWVRGDALAISMRSEPDGSVSGGLGVGLSDDVTFAASGPLVDFFTWRLEEGTSEFASELDTNMDGVVTDDELFASNLVASLLAPDVDLMTEHDGELILWPLQDGEKDRLSMGVEFHAVEVGLQ
jgi:hypothetical protein